MCVTVRGYACVRACMCVCVHGIFNSYSYREFHWPVITKFLQLVISKHKLSQTQSDLLHQSYNHNYHYWQPDLQQLPYWIKVCLVWKPNDLELFFSSAVRAL